MLVVALCCSLSGEMVEEIFLGSLRTWNSHKGINNKRIDQEIALTPCYGSICKDQLIEDWFCLYFQS